MTEQIVEAVAKKIHEILPEFTIYKENPKQGLKEPCVIITYHSSPIKDLLSNKWSGDFFYVHDLVTVSFIANDTDLTEILNYARVYLKWLDLDDGTRMMTVSRSGEVLPDHTATLSFYVNYQLKVVPEEIPRAEILDFGTDIYK